MYLGENVGNAAKMNLALSLLYGATSAALAEAMALVEASEMSHKDFVDALSATKLASPFLLDKCRLVGCLDPSVLSIRSWHKVKTQFFL